MCGELGWQCSTSSSFNTCCEGLRCSAVAGVSTYYHFCHLQYSPANLGIVLYRRRRRSVSRFVLISEQGPRMCLNVCVWWECGSAPQIHVCTRTVLLWSWVQVMRHGTELKFMFIMNYMCRRTAIEFVKFLQLNWILFVCVCTDSFSITTVLRVC